MKLLRIVAVAALTAFGGITGGTCIVHATPATGVLLGAPAVKTLQTPTMGGLSPSTRPIITTGVIIGIHIITGTTITGAIGIGAIGEQQSAPKHHKPVS